MGGSEASEIKVLGPLSVVTADGPRDPGGETPRLVLALLAADVGRVVSYTRLAEGLWGDEPPLTARKTLQVHVSNLRRRLGDAFPIHTSPHGYLLSSEEVSVDAVLFEREVDQACGLCDEDPRAASALFAQALRRWRGEAYADLVQHDGIRPEVARLEEIRMRAVERRIEAELIQGNYADVVADLGVLTADYPYREHLHVLRMLALYRAGRQTEALRHYEKARRTLGEELGIDPSRELRELHQRVLEHAPELDGPSTQSTPVVDDRVEHHGFHIYESLGRRSDGTVYRARQSSLGRDVALEVSESAEAGDQPVLASMDHPHLVSVIDAWHESTTSYVAMPLLCGTLAQSDTDGWTWREALSVVTQVSSALQYLHDHEVVHGAVRPENILLDEDDNAFLTDASTDSRGPTTGGQRAVDLVALARVAHDLLTRCTPQGLPAGVVRVLDRAEAAAVEDADMRVSAFADALAGTVYGSLDLLTPPSAD